jgi:hypothetical protein
MLWQLLVPVVRQNCALLHLARMAIAAAGQTLDCCAAWLLQAAGSASSFRRPRRPAKAEIVPVAKIELMPADPKQQQALWQKQHQAHLSILVCRAAASACKRTQPSRKPPARHKAANEPRSA